MNEPRLEGPDGGPLKMGDYELVAELGRGSLIEVLSAVSPDGTPVLIKRLRPELARRPSEVRMFSGEARLASSLQHENLLPVLEIGHTESGEPFLAMERLDLDLRALLAAARKARKRIPTWVSLFVAKETLAALSYIHELTDESRRPLSLFHGDVTPWNIFLSYQGAVKLGDFGVASVASGTGDGEDSAPYTAPEALAGRVPDRRADIYSIGALLWELLTTGSNAGRPGAPFAPPSAVNPEAPLELDACVLQSLESEPERRSPSATSLEWQLRSMLDKMRGKGRSTREEAGRAIREVVSPSVPSVSAAPAPPPAPPALSPAPAPPAPAPAPASSVRKATPAPIESSALPPLPKTKAAPSRSDTFKETAPSQGGFPPAARSDTLRTPEAAPLSARAPEPRASSSNLPAATRRPRIDSVLTPSKPTQETESLLNPRLKTDAAPLIASAGAASPAAVSVTPLKPEPPVPSLASVLSPIANAPRAKVESPAPDPAPAKPNLPNLASLAALAMAESGEGEAPSPPPAPAPRPAPSALASPSPTAVAPPPPKPAPPAIGAIPPPAPPPPKPAPPAIGAIPPAPPPPKAAPAAPAIGAIPPAPPPPKPATPAPVAPIAARAAPSEAPPLPMPSVPPPPDELLDVAVLFGAGSAAPPPPPPPPAPRPRLASGLDLPPAPPGMRESPPMLSTEAPNDISSSAFYFSEFTPMPGPSKLDPDAWSGEATGSIPALEVDDEEVESSAIERETHELGLDPSLGTAADLRATVDIKGASVAPERITSDLGSSDLPDSALQFLSSAPPPPPPPRPAIPKSAFLAAEPPTDDVGRDPLAEGAGLFGDPPSDDEPPAESTILSPAPDYASAPPEPRKSKPAPTQFMFGQVEAATRDATEGSLTFTGVTSGPKERVAPTRPTSGRDTLDLLPAFANVSFEGAQPPPADKKKPAAPRVAPKRPGSAAASPPAKGEVLPPHAFLGKAAATADLPAQTTPEQQGFPFWVASPEGSIAGPLDLDQVIRHLTRVQHGPGSLSLSADKVQWLDVAAYARFAGLEFCLTDPGPPAKKAYEGDLRQQSLWPVLAGLTNTRATGRLIILSEGSNVLKRREVHVDNGEPTYVYSNDADLQLPELLVRHKILTKAQLPELLHEILKTRKFIDLVANRFSNELAQLWPEVMTDRIAEIMKWKAGRYMFEPDGELWRHRPFAKSMLILLNSLSRRAKGDKKA